MAVPYSETVLQEPEPFLRASLTPVTPHLSQITLLNYYQTTHLLIIQTQIVAFEVKFELVSPYFTLDKKEKRLPKENLLTAVHKCHATGLVAAENVY